MKIVVGSMDYRLQQFIKASSFSEKMLLINKMCNVKTIKDESDIIIPFGIIMNNGLISNTLVHLEELIITINPKILYYGNSFNTPFFEKLKNRYGFELKYINLKNLNQKFFF